MTHRNWRILGALLWLQIAFCPVALCEEDNKLDKSHPKEVSPIPQPELKEVNIQLIQCKRQGTRVVCYVLASNSTDYDYGVVVNVKQKDGLRNTSWDKFGKPVLHDDQGSTYKATSAGCGNRTAPGNGKLQCHLLSGTKPQIQISFEGVPDSLKVIPLLKISMGVGKRGQRAEVRSIESRNVPILD